MMKNLKNESGRSMVEMLGVLAVIGVLSVGGIAGYRMAMQKHIDNQGLNAYNVAMVDYLELAERALREDKCLEIEKDYGNGAHFKADICPEAKFDEDGWGNGYDLDLPYIGNFELTFGKPISIDACAQILVNMGGRDGLCNTYSAAINNQQECMGCPWNDTTLESAKKMCDGTYYDFLTPKTEVTSIGTYYGC